MPDTPPPQNGSLEHAKLLWSSVSNSMADGNLIPKATFQEYGEFARTSALLSIAESLQTIAATVNDGSFDYWLERLGTSLTSAIELGLRAGK